MKIKITKNGEVYEADPVELPGSPPVGRGGSIAEALGDLLIQHQERLGVQIEVGASAEQAELERRANALEQR